MIRSPFRSTPAFRSVSPGESDLAVWVKRRQALVANALRLVPILAVTAGVMGKAFPNAALLLSGVSVLGLAWGGGLWLAYRSVARQVQGQPIRPLQAVRVPKVRTYATLAEGESAGWRFFGACGTYAGQPIPGFAELDGAWFAYRGLDLDLRSTAEGERVFGVLAFTSCPVPAPAPSLLQLTPA